MSDTKLTPDDIKQMSQVGIDVDEQGRSGTFIVADDSVEKSSSKNKGVETLGLSVALKKYGWVKDYLWRMVAPHKDEFTEMVYKNEQEKRPLGQFLHIKKGTVSKDPFQSCFFIKLNRSTQMLHNIIVVDDDVEFHILSGCAIAAYSHEGMHLGITEIYIGENSTLSYTMIHEWAPGMIVRPRTGVEVGAHSKFMTNYISMRATKMTQMYPEIHLVGDGASARSTSLILSPLGSVYDLGVRAYLSAPNTSAELISRNITTGGKAISRGHIIADAQGTRGHLECNGLFLSDDGVIDAVPELSANVRDTDLLHEAALGKIDEEKLEYLMARGLSREQATQMIVKGFLDVGILGLPKALEDEVKHNMELMEEEAL